MFEELRKEFEVDIRGFKDKSVWCKDKQCINCKHREPNEENKSRDENRENKMVKANIQKEVDVALGVYPIRYKVKNPGLSTVVFVSGDGDLVDSLKCLNQMGVTTYVISWSQGTNFEYANTANHKIYLDDIFETISKPDPRFPNAVNNCDVLRAHKNKFPPQIIVAATHRYPDT